MASVIDVKKLSKKEIQQLVYELIESEMITSQFLLELAESKEKTDDLKYIESLIDKHFEEYDEVFRKLA
ncbi:MAG: hypothetical protein WAU01_08815 [Saprospiraceae bacterium]